LQYAVSREEVAEAYMRAISDTVPAAGHGLYLLDPETLQPLDVRATVPDSFLQRYEDEGRRDDPVLGGAVATRSPTASNRLSTSCWQGSAVFGVLENAGFLHSLEAPLLIDGAVHGTLNMARGHDDRPFDDDELLSMAAIAEQVGAALARAERFEKVSRDTAVLADALDAAAQPVVVTTVDGEVIFRNRTATRSVPGTTTSFFDRAGPVLLRALEGLRDEGRRIVTLHESDDRPPDDAAVSPDPRGVLAVKAVRLPSAHDAVVSFLSFRPTGVPTLPEGAVPLSRREHEIAELVSRGLTTRQIAELSYVSENTVKQHLKRIFAKLEVNSRAELVQAVWQSSVGARHPGDDDDDLAAP
jgi:DNA-binding CsgD family transcriptional regulator/PAS domain-containing protein